MKKYLTVLGIEGKLALRSLDGVIFGIAMPIGVLLLIAMISGNQLVQGGGYTFLESSFPALATVGICATAFMGIPLTIADYRDKKILKHFFTTPSSPGFLLSIQVIIAGLIAITSTIGVTLVATLGLGYRMTGSALGFVGIYLLVLISMYSIGMMIASLCQTIKQANLVCTLVYFPMLLFSGAIIPFELFPSGMQRIANILPLTQGIRLLKIVSIEGIQAVPLFPAAYLIGLAIIGIMISVKTFRWE